MEKEYLEVLGKFVDFKNTILKYSQVFKEDEVDLTLDLDNRDPDKGKKYYKKYKKKILVELEKKKRNILAFVKQLQKSDKKYPLVEIINKYKLDDMEILLLGYSWALKLTHKNHVFNTPTIDLLEIMCNGDYSEFVRLVLTYLSKNSKLIKHNIFHTGISPFDTGGSLSDEFFEKITQGIYCDKIESEEQKQNKNEFPTPEEIYKILSKKVIGQEEAKRVLSISIHRHYQRISGKSRIKNDNILMIGPTGVGKTYLVRTIAEHLNVPIVFCSANEFTETGYIGRDTRDIIIELYEKAEGNVELTEKGIVFIDEIDKIASPKKEQSHGRDVSGRSVQEELLDLIECYEKRKFSSFGALLPKNIFIDTNKILFIAAGAFDGLGELIEKRRKRTVGFANEIKEVDKIFDITVDDLIEYGLIPELIGRFSSIVYLPPLSKEELVKIMKVSEDSVLNEYLDSLKEYRIEVEFTPDALEKIAEIAIKRKTGVRGLRSILERILRPYFFNYYKLSGKRIIIDRTYIEKAFNSQLISI